MTTSWTTTVDRSAADVPTATDWNNYLGAGGNLDFLFFRSWLLVGVDATERTTTSGSAVDLCTISGLNITPAQPILIVGGFRKDTGGGVLSSAIGLKINSTTVIEANVGTLGIAATSDVSRVEDGSFVVLIGPRTASYPWSIIGMFQTRVSSTGAVARATTLQPLSSTFTASQPLVDITSIVLRGITANSVTVAVKDVAVYAGGITL